MAPPTAKPDADRPAIDPSMNWERSVRALLNPDDLGPARYERKFRVTSVTSHEVLRLVRRHPAIFREPFPPRFVNNIYLDNEDRDAFRDNVVGCQSRVKVRVRWYGEPFGEIERPVLELKIKDGLIGWKKQYSLAPMVVTSGFCQTRMLDTFRTSEIPPPLALALQAISPSLLNRYRRRYFLSADGRYRVTVDTAMQFYPIKRYANLFLANVINHDESVLELKYDRAHADDADRVSTWFPFRLTKNSKYVDGLETLDWW